MTCPKGMRSLITFYITIFIFKIIIPMCPLAVYGCVNLNSPPSSTIHIDFCSNLHMKNIFTLYTNQQPKTFYALIGEATHAL